MSNVNVKKVLVESASPSLTLGKEYEVFKDAGYTYIVDEVNDRLYFDLENKTFGYFNKHNVGLFRFREGDLTIVPVIEKVKQLGDCYNTVTGKVYEVFYDGSNPYIIDGAGDKLYFDLEAQTYGYYREDNVDSWHFCSSSGLFLEEVKEDKENVVGKLTKVKQVGDVDNLVTGKVYDVEYDGSDPFILDDSGDRLYFNLESQRYGYFKATERWVMLFNGVFLVAEDMEQVNEVKIEEGLKFKVVEDLVLEGATYREGEIYTLGEELNYYDGVNYAVDGENGASYVNLASRLKEAFEEGYFEVLEEATQVEVQTDKVPRCITLKDIEEGKIKVGDRVEYVEGMLYSVESIDLDDLDNPLLIDGYGWVSSEELYSFKRVNVAVEYLDFQEDREPLATYDSEDVEIVEEGGKLVVYSKENK